MPTITTRSAERNARMALAGATFGNPEKAAVATSALQSRMEKAGRQQDDQPSTESGEIAALEHRVGLLEERVEKLENQATTTIDQGATASAAARSASLIDTRGIFARMNSAGRGIRGRQPQQATRHQA